METAISTAKVEWKKQHMIKGKGKVRDMARKGRSKKGRYSVQRKKTKWSQVRLCKRTVDQIRGERQGNQNKFSRQNPSYDGNAGKGNKELKNQATCKDRC